MEGRSQPRDICNHYNQRNASNTPMPSGKCLPMRKDDEVNKSTGSRGKLIKNHIRTYPGNERIIFSKTKEKYYTEPYIKSGDKGKI